MNFIFKTPWVLKGGGSKGRGGRKEGPLVFQAGEYTSASLFKLTLRSIWADSKGMSLASKGLPHGTIAGRSPYVKFNTSANSEGGVK